MAIELAADGARVNAVSLGIIKTAMNAAASPKELAAMASAHPLGRMGEIQDVVDGILYLEAAGLVTGEILRIDGGQVAGHVQRRASGERGAG